MRNVLDGLPYPVIVTDNAPGEATAIAARERQRIIVVYDRAVEQRADCIARSLRSAGCDLRTVAGIEAGERRKHWKTVNELHSIFLEAGVDRGSLVIAVGGGTLTDIAGFAAATFLRGVRWIAVPTTVMGMVDAAIGGKTGVNRPEAKNVIGSIWPPVAVVSDLDALATLPSLQRKSGLAEIVKSAVIGDAPLLDAVEGFDPASVAELWAPVIIRAAAVKVAVVARDPLDQKERAVLNLGHTFAHAIENASRYRIAHGAAVALGLRAAGILGRDRTGWPLTDHARMLLALRSSGLRAHMRGLSADAIVGAMSFDKKRIDGNVKFVLPVRLGEVRAGYVVPEHDVRGALTELERSAAGGRW